MDATAGTSLAAPSISGEFMSDIQGTAAGAVDKFGNQIGEAIEKAGQLIDEKTGGKYSEQIQAGVGKVEDTLDGLDGKNDDIGPEPTSEAPAEPTLPDTPTEPTDPTQPGTDPGYAPTEPETQPGYGTAPPTPEAGSAQQP
jgi:hypothetical protein